MKSRVGLYTLPINICTFFNQVFSDEEMVLVTGNHQAGMAMPISQLNICKTENENKG